MHTGPSITTLVDNTAYSCNGHKLSCRFFTFLPKGISSREDLITRSTQNIVCYTVIEFPHTDDTRQTKFLRAMLLELT